MSFTEESDFEKALITMLTQSYGWEPEVLQYKLKNEAINTVLLPNSVREVDDKVFDSFPDLENIVLEKGNPCLHREHFRAIALKAREKRKGELHLKQYPFANLAEMLKKKQAEQ